MSEMNNKNNNQNREHKGMLKHGIGMMLCCLLPILLVAVVPLLGIKGGAILPLLASLACPLGMLFMMFSMRGSNNRDGSCHGDTKENLQSDKDK